MRPRLPSTSVTACVGVDGPIRCSTVGGWHNAERVDANDRVVVIEVGKAAKEEDKTPRVGGQINPAQSPLEVRQRVDEREAGRGQGNACLLLDLLGEGHRAAGRDAAVNLVVVDALRHVLEGLPHVPRTLHHESSCGSLLAGVVNVNVDRNPGSHKDLHELGRMVHGGGGTGPGDHVPHEATRQRLGRAERRGWPASLQAPQC